MIRTNLSLCAKVFVVFAFNAVPVLADSHFRSTQIRADQRLEDQETRENNGNSRSSSPKNAESQPDDRDERRSTTKTPATPRNVRDRNKEHQNHPQKSRHQLPPSQHQRNPEPPRFHPLPVEHHDQKRDEHNRDKHRHDEHTRDDHRHDEHRSYDHRYDHRPPRPYLDSHHNHRPNYRLYKRHRYIYYYTPWYNTLFLAPLFFHYYDVGYRLEVLPTPYVRIFVSGRPYFYSNGVYYRSHGAGYIVVSAPIGAFVQTLPAGFVAFTIGLNSYYFVNDTYYAWDETRDGFAVVGKPIGAEEALAKATEGRLYVYPNKGQSEEQQAKDRYECHLWAVSESGIDPSLEETQYTANEQHSYKRAISACLEAKDYTVK